MHRQLSPAEPEAAANARLHGLSLDPEVQRVLRSRPVPSPAQRALQRLAMRTGRMNLEKDWLRPLARLRRASLAGGAEDPPRFLVRVDEFPDSAGLDDPRLGYEASSRFHEVMAQAGVAHLLAVVPQWTHDPRNPDAQGGRELDDRDVELLARMRADRVTFAQHGTTHRTRYRSPHHHSEFCGLPDAELAELLARGREQLRKAGIQPRVLVPPYNRFDAAQWPVLAANYDVVTGGPESVSLFGFHGGPLWRDQAVYLPSYPPLYARAADATEAVERLLRTPVGGWIPLVLHMGWEAEDNFASLQRLAAMIAPYAVDWDEFLADVDSTRPQ